MAMFMFALALIQPAAPSAMPSSSRDSVAGKVVSCGKWDSTAFVFSQLPELSLMPTTVSG